MAHLPAVYLEKGKLGLCRLSCRNNANPEVGTVQALYIFISRRPPHIAVASLKRAEIPNCVFVIACELGI